MKKLICIISVFAMLLTGCSSSKTAGDITSDSNTEKMAEVCMTVGDVEIRNEYVEYIASMMMQQTGGTDVEAARQQAITEIEYMSKLMAIGQAMNLDVTADYEKYVSQFGDTNIKAQLGISDELFDFLCYTDVYSAKVQTVFAEEQGVNFEEYFKNNFWRAKHLLLMTQDKTDEEKAEIKAKIDGLYEQVKNGADFDALIKEHNEDPDVDSNPDGYIFTTQEMVPEFEDGVKNINVGEFNLVETSYGYHIVQRLALDETPEKFEQFLNENITKISGAVIDQAEFDKYIEDKTKEYGITVNKIEE